MKVVNDRDQAQPAEKTVPRKTLDDWQRKDQKRRSEEDGQSNPAPLRGESAT
ncbi:hypothetical protein [Bradyrhizobium sp. OAE829]|uniref:hypothetical protein n=1 Tax=Bradyrhizobium sp. OAE829 TaxID=2663807 RepID=UPI0017892313